MALPAVTLDDKYQAESGELYLTGTQALVRLPLMQRRRDLAAGRNSAGFISGYRGSPLGGYDRELWKARGFLEAHHVHFRPGVNEELAATSVWGSQQLNMFPGARYDGVFAIWYGKGAGLDRCGDVMRHANAAGTAPNGGVLAVVGDDHALKSSSQAAHAEPTFADLNMPVLYPADIHEMLDFGLLGWAMSRFSGCWIGFKVLADTMDSSAVVRVDRDEPRIVLPRDVAFPPDGVHIRWPDPWSAGEVRLNGWKLPAAIAFARANELNRVTLASPRPRLGIVTTGKSWLDVRQAMRDLGLDDRAAAEAGITILKLGMPWPADADLLRSFGDGLEEVLVVEEKRRLIEAQTKDALYGLPDGRRPRVVGQRDEQDRPLISPNGENNPDVIARVIAARVRPLIETERMRARLAFLDAKARQAARPAPAIKRTAYFCSGCPHNSSTKIPEGSRAIAGIGCHYMAVMADRNTATFAAMGGEGTQWIGQAPFTDTPHVFVNLGDGTYYHSGLLAIRAAIAAGVNVTYKVLFNDAVAMTGGQPFDGPLTVPRIARQVLAEGAARVLVVADDPEKYPLDAGFPAEVEIRPREELDQVQRSLRAVPGVTVLIYDQTCAAEKRRRRKRGAYPDPQKRMFINRAVCEGCGDCSTTSNCLSVTPVETEFGRKRAIDQSSCNKDYSCADGFCPSFVVVHGGVPRRRATARRQGAVPETLPEPALPALDAGRSYGIFITGVGGTGVVTIGALLGMAAYLEGKAVSLTDVLGMAQKGGAVVSHVRLAARRADILSPKLNAGAADLLLGCDLLVAAEPQTLATIAPDATRVILNTHETITGAFTVNPDLDFPVRAAKNAVVEAAGAARVDMLDATRLATALMGDSVATNLFLLGYAWQQGLVPLSREALERAIELNGVAVDNSRLTFRLGRWAALDRAAVERLVAPPRAVDGDLALSRDLDEIIARRVAALTAYQDQAYAERYLATVAKVREAEARKARGMTGLAKAVARNLYKLMAYKDEYEVARLHADPAFLQQLDAEFENVAKLEVLLAPPLLARRDPETGHLKKRAYGPWIFTAFRLLAACKGLRGTAFDPFGRTAERRAERALIADYEATVDELVERLDHDHHPLAVEIARLPERIRGYGHIKDQAIESAARRRDDLLASFRNAAPASRTALSA